MRNPLILGSVQDTAQATQEALEALMVLMADQHSGLVRLLGPIEQAVAWIAEQAPAQLERAEAEAPATYSASAICAAAQMSSHSG